MISDLLKLIHELDQVDASEMDIELRGGVHNIRPDTDKTGTEKFETKRRIKRVNRLLKNTDHDLNADTHSDSEPTVSVLSQPESDGIRVVVDQEADATIEDGALRITIPRTDYTELREVEIDSPAIESRVVNNGFTTIDLQPA